MSVGCSSFSSDWLSELNKLPLESELKSPSSNDSTSTPHCEELLMGCDLGMVVQDQILVAGVPGVVLLFGNPAKGVPFADLITLLVRIVPYKVKMLKVSASPECLATPRKYPETSFELG